MSVNGGSSTGARRALPAPLSEFSLGAISPSVSLSERLEDLHREIPESASQRNTLRLLGSDFVFVRRIGGAGGRAEAWLVLIRFGRVIEDRFGLDREIVGIYSPFDDLQIRTVDQIDQIVRELPDDRRSADSSVVFVWAPDERLEKKMTSWSKEGRTFVPLCVAVDGTDPARQQLNSIAKHLYAKDPYRANAPVTGSQFFGREGVIGTLSTQIFAGQVPGLFGLRKTGKTSILKEIERRMNDGLLGSGEAVAIYQDLEYLRDIDAFPVQQLVPDLVQALQKAVAERFPSAAHQGHLVNLRMFWTHFYPW